MLRNVDVDHKCDMQLRICGVGQELQRETDLWREMNFVTSAELYMDGPPHREYLCFVPTPLHELT